MNEVTLKEESSAIIPEGRSIVMSKEIEAKITVALKFPRDMISVEGEIKRMCQRIRFADGSIYGLPRGDKVVSGPSVQFAKGIAQLYGNLEHGHYIEERTADYTKGYAYCWDYQRNLNIKKDFYVIHEKYSKRNGARKVIDQTEVTEIVNSQISRAVRNCILEIVPWYIIEDAQEICALTMKEDAKKTPIEKRREQSKKAFSDLGVTEDQIKEKMGKVFNELDDDDLFELRKAYSAIKDRFITVDKWLGKEVEEADTKTNDLNEKLKAK